MISDKRLGFQDEVGGENDDEHDRSARMNDKLLCGKRGGVERAKQQSKRASSVDQLAVPCGGCKCCCKESPTKNGFLFIVRKLPCQGEPRGSMYRGGRF